MNEQDGQLLKGRASMQPLTAWMWGPVAALEDILPGQGIAQWLGLLVLAAWLLAVPLTALLAWGVRACKTSMDPIAAGSLRYAAAKGDIKALEQVERLTGESCFEVDSCSPEGFTALMSACAGGHAHAARWLLRRGANVHAMKNDGWNDTALHYAASKGWHHVCLVLLAYGADPQRKNFHGASALDLAKESGSQETTQLLQAVQNSRPPLPEQLDELLPALEVDDTPRQLDWVGKRRWDGWGTPGTQPYPGLHMIRAVSVAVVLATFTIVIWRATRTISTISMFHTVFSITNYASDLLSMYLLLGRLICVWRPISRVHRDMFDMGIPEDKWPSVDVFIVNYTEPIHIIEGTIYAALNQQYVESKLCVQVLDDGKNPELESLCRRIQQEIRAAGRAIRLFYTARPKVKNVPHHAKAGNINHTLTKAACSNASYVLILDCDMIPLPNCLRNAMPHFLEIDPRTGDWRVKEQAALIQMPQCFYNLSSLDPWWHTSSEWYIISSDGADGVGSASCVGTNAIFSRACLLAQGGQNYFSVTEDAKTACNMVAQGFSTMHLSEKLVWGLAPNDIPSMRRQRVRWCTGGLQILTHGNPLFQPGLAMVPTTVFLLHILGYAFSLPQCLTILTPIVCLFTDRAPGIMVAWEVAAFVLPLMISVQGLNWMQTRWLTDTNTDFCVWRQWQASVWLAGVNLEAMLTLVYTKYLANPLRIVMRRDRKSIGFKVTSKDVSDTPFWTELKSSIPALIYWSLCILGTLYAIVEHVSGNHRSRVTWVGAAYATFYSFMMFPYASHLLGWSQMDEIGEIKWVPRQTVSAPHPEYTSIVNPGRPKSPSCGSLRHASPISDAPFGLSKADSAALFEAPPHEMVSLNLGYFPYAVWMTPDKLLILAEEDLAEPDLDRSPQVYLPPHPVTRHYKFRLGLLAFCLPILTVALQNPWAVIIR